jgi:hypothetical protein
MKVSLTRTQRLRAEIEEIASMANMDHWNILDYEEERRTPQLELMKDQLVRGEIIITYTFIDELLSDIIVNKYFRGPNKQFTYKRLWRTKKFQAFSHHVLDGIYLLGKGGMGYVIGFGILLITSAKIFYRVWLILWRVVANHGLFAVF